MFNGTVSSRSAAPPAGYLGVDLGVNTFSYTSSKVSWARQQSPSQSGGNFTIELSSLSLSSTVVPLAGNVQSLKNSTVVEQSFSSSTPVLVGQTSCSPSVQLAFRNMTGVNSYDRDVVISGTLGCGGPVSAPTLTLQLVNPLDLGVSKCDTSSHTANGKPVPPCTSIFFGNMGFSWQGMPAAYDNATRILTVALTASFNFDPLALDGSAGDFDGSCDGTSACSVTVTTSNSNDVLIFYTNYIYDNGCTTTTAPTITSSPSLSWTQRSSTYSAHCGVFDNLAWFYATWSSSGSITITATAPSGRTFGHDGLIAFGISGANTGSPFDSNSPWVGTYGDSNCPVSGGNNQPCVRGVTTANANDFVFNIEADGAGSMAAGTIAGSAATMIRTGTSWGNDVSAQYRVLSATTSSDTESFGTYIPNGFVAMGDAIVQASSSSVTQPITCTTANSASSATMTLSGASVSPTTLSCDGSAHNFTANPSSTITITVPTDGSTSRYRLSGGATSTTVTTCSSGTCSGGGSATFTIYYQYSQSVSYAIYSCDSGATCSAPMLSYTQTGTLLQPSLSTTAQTYWIDYGTTSSVPNFLTDSLGNLYYSYAYSWYINSANLIGNPVIFWCGL
jgi:hypothetical protein